MNIKLITKKQFQQLQKNGERYKRAKAEDEAVDFKPVVKLFTPDAQCTWLLSFVYPDDEDVAFGFCDLGVGFPEYGDVRLSELKTICGSFGLPVERDRYFVPAKLLTEYVRGWPDFKDQEHSGVNEPAVVVTLPEVNRFRHVNALALNDLETNAVISLACEALSYRYQPGQEYTQPGEVATFLKLKLAERKNEVFAVMFLNNRHRIQAFEELFQGTVDSASVYPRVIAQRALELNSSAIIVAHNHPSGYVVPSSADEAITKKLADSLKLLDIRLLDHFVVTLDETYSFAEHGLL